MAHTIPLPDIDTRIAFTNDKGEVIKEVELMILESLLVQAQEGLDLRKSADQRLRWMVNFAELLTKEVGCYVSPSVASFASRRITQLTNTLKKTFESLPTFTSSTAATQPTETRPSNTCTTETSPASPPSENSVSDAPPAS